MSGNGVTMTIEVEGLRDFARKLEETIVPIALRMEETIQETADIVLREARAKASFSPTIQDSITKKINTPTDVEIQIGYFLGRLYEVGSGTMKNPQPSWQHPTFGHDPTDTQKTRPMLAPAFKGKDVVVLERTLLATETVLNEKLSGVFDEEGHQ